MLQNLLCSIPSRYVWRIVFHQVSNDYVFVLSATSYIPDFVHLLPFLFQEELSSFMAGTALILIAFCLLIYSSCVTIVVPYGSVFTDYFIAQSFRTSHYFVSFLSQGECAHRLSLDIQSLHLFVILFIGLLTLSGLRLSVCSPLSVEFPRSLVEVVVAWNIPMHRYLHSCKFFHT